MTEVVEAALWTDSARDLAKKLIGQMHEERARLEAEVAMLTWEGSLDVGLAAGGSLSYAWTDDQWFVVLLEEAIEWGRA